jgi:hypothetical protein
MMAMQGSQRPSGCLSDFVLDQLVADELAGQPAERAAREHLAGCDRCAERLRYFENVDVPALPASVVQRARKATTRSRLWALPFAAALAAAVVLLLSRAGMKPEPIADSGIRTKGAIALTVIARRASGEVTRLAPGDTVLPGDALRFEVAAAQPGFVAVMGLDAKGVATIYAPASGSMQSLPGGPPVVLPDAIVTDDTLGAERIVAVFCERSMPLEELRSAGMRALSQAAADPQRVGRLDTPCAETAFEIEKKP